MDKHANVKLEETGIRYKKWMQWKELPYSEIVRVYRQLEEARGKICCGTAYFEIHRVVFETKSGEKIAVEVQSRDEGVEILEQMKEKKPDLLIGLP